MKIFQWQPIVGCSAASAGCANCQAVAAAAADLKDPTGRAFSGVTRLVEAAFLSPSRLAEPRAVFVCNHGDLFHPATPDAWIDRVFDAMEADPRHAYQVLTKRSARMKAYVLARYGGQPSPRQIALGVSAERQQEAEVRVRDLAATPAVVRYVILYPLLGPIDLTGLLEGVGMVGAGEEQQRPAKSEWFALAERVCAASGVIFARAPLLPMAA